MHDFLSFGDSNAMKTTGCIVVVGLGEIGKPLLHLISEQYDVIGVDLSPVDFADDIDVMHICYPFQIGDFIGECCRYIELFKPRLTVINSTVAVGTTRAIVDRTGAAVVNSPVRGKHAHMLDDLRSYTKFVGALDSVTAQKAVRHFESLGLKTRALSSPEATELAKLSETTYFGLLIAWAQELERYCEQSGVIYDEATSFYEEVKFFPSVKYFPGVIGGHCVMPNIELLCTMDESVLLQAIKSSNLMKVGHDSRSMAAVAI
jgi:UDP-N-acetyl-D-mannosaminuronate dehydrogenase